MSLEATEYWTKKASLMPKMPKAEAPVKDGWMSLEELKSCGAVCIDLCNPTNLRGGIPLDSRDPHNMWIDISDKHNLIISSSGTGKTRRLIMQYILSLANTTESAVIFDPKGENLRMTGGLMEKSGKKIYVINGREPDKSSGWNPFEEPFNLYYSGDDDLKDEGISAILEIARTLYPLTPDAREPYWDLCGQSLLAAMCWEALKDAYDVDDINLSTVSSLFNEHFQDDDSINRLIAKVIDDELEYSLVSPATYNAESTRRCIVSSSRSRLTPFIQSRAIRDMLSRSDIHFSDIVKQPSIIYLVTPDETNSLNGIVGVFIKLLYKFLIKEAYKNGGALDNTFHFLIDETANIGRIDDLDAMLSACRSRNMRITTVFQSLGQIDMLYGSAAETIKGNCGNWFYIFSRDRMTLQEISFLLGKDKEGNPRMSISELQTLDEDRGEAIVLKARKKPFMGQLTDISKFGIPLDLPVPETYVPRERTESEEEDPDDYIIGETEPGNSMMIPKERDPDWFEKEIARLSLDEFKAVFEDYRRKMDQKYGIMVDDLRFVHGDNDSCDHTAVALVEVTGVNDICTRSPSLTREVEEFMTQYKFFTDEVDKIVTFLDTLMVWHDEFLAERLRKQGFKINKRSLRKFGERSDRLRDHIKMAL